MAKPQDRAAFEAWHKNEFGWICETRGNGNYLDGSASGRWRVWKAATEVAKAAGLALEHVGGIQQQQAETPPLLQVHFARPVQNCPAGIPSAQPCAPEPQSDLPEWSDIGEAYGRAVPQAWRDRVETEQAARQPAPVLPVSERDMAIAQAVRQACVNSYSPDDSASDYTDKMGDIDLATIIRAATNQDKP